MSDRGSLPTTHWSLLRRAGSPDRTLAARALGELLVRYLPALRAHLLLGKRLDPHRVDDLLQAFVTGKFLEKNLAAEADPARGRFRNLVLTALDRFVISEHRREAAAKRRADGVLDEGIAEDVVAPTPTPGREFDAAWAREVIAAALDRMQSDCGRTGRDDVWEVFDARLVRPIFEGTAPPDYAELIARFAIPSPTVAANLLITGKRMFARCLRAVISDYATSPEEISAELAELEHALNLGS